jgi:hypothetical protein
MADRPAFYLPDFCRAQSVLAVILIAALVALLFTLARHGISASFWAISGISNEPGDQALDPGYPADLRAQTSGLSVGFQGPFDPAHGAGVYGNLDVLVVPSLWLENSPLVIHEALMAGVPVIGSEIGGIPGLIRHEVNGLLVQPGSVDALARALERLATDRGLLDRLRQAPHGVKSIEDDAAEWDARYAQVLAAHHAVPFTRR